MPKSVDKSVKACKQQEHIRNGAVQLPLPSDIVAQLGEEQCSVGGTRRGGTQSVKHRSRTEPAPPQPFR